MMTMRRIALLATLASATAFTIATTATHAATEFADGLIPAELVDHITGNANARYFSDIPTGFPLPATLPQGLQLRLLGSMQQTPLLRLYLDSQQSYEQVLGGLRQAYAAAGWVDVSNDALMGRTLTLCHDTLGELHITTSGLPVFSTFDNSAVTTGTRVTATHFNIRSSLQGIRVVSTGPVPGIVNGTVLGNIVGSGGVVSYPVNTGNTLLPGGYYGAVSPSPTCAERASSSNFLSALMQQMETLMPVLEVPAQATPGTNRLMQGSSNFGGSANGFNANLTREGIIEVAGSSAAALYVHFAAQLLAQGWDQDSGNPGSTSATSVWLHPDGAAALGSLGNRTATVHGTLTVLAIGANRYRISFEVQAMSGDVAGGFGVIGVYPQ